MFIKSKMIEHVKIGVFGTRAKGKKEENSVCVLFVNAKKPTNTIKSRSETATATSADTCRSPVHSVQ